MGSGERVVVAHSLSCLLWLHTVGRELVDPPADRVLLVAPPSPAVTSSYVEMAGFLAPVNPASVWASSRAPVRLVASADDPYSTEGTDRRRLRTMARVLSWAIDPATRFATG